jgi:hypothetical protein
MAKDLSEQLDKGGWEEYIQNPEKWYADRGLNREITDRAVDAWNKEQWDAGKKKNMLVPADNKMNQRKSGRASKQHSQFQGRDMSRMYRNKRFGWDHTKKFKQDMIGFFLGYSEGQQKLRIIEESKAKGGSHLHLDTKPPKDGDPLNRFVWYDRAGGYTGGGTNPKRVFGKTHSWIKPILEKERTSIYKNKLMISDPIKSKIVGEEKLYELEKHEASNLGKAVSNELRKTKEEIHSESNTNYFKNISVLEYLEERRKPILDKWGGNYAPQRD